MERVNGNLKTAQKLLVAALQLEHENPAVLMVRSSLMQELSIEAALHCFKNANFCE